MARATGKDHARINLDIWGDDAWLELTPAAQHLYFVLWTSPQLSYCGVGDWHAGRIAAKARGWTAAAVEAAAAELSRELFLVIDADTGEFLLRSWIKHDGLWRGPNMAVSMANARADLASRTLRAVVVFEVLKIKAREPKSNSWERAAVITMLSQKAIDPASLAPFTPDATPAPTPSATLGLTLPPTLNQGVGANPTVDPGATPAPAPAPFSNYKKKGNADLDGYVGDGTENGQPPPRHCPNHPGGTTAPCPACGAARQRSEAWHAEHKRIEAAERQAVREQHAADRRAEIAACDLCGPDGYRGAVVCDHVDRTHQPGRLAAMAAARRTADVPPDSTGERSEPPSAHDPMPKPAESLSAAYGGER
jgi:hypothetical protein